MRFRRLARSMDGLPILTASPPSWILALKIASSNRSPPPQNGRTTPWTTKRNRRFWSPLWQSSGSGAARTTSSSAIPATMRFAHSRAGRRSARPGRSRLTPAAQNAGRRGQRNGARTPLRCESNATTPPVKPHQDARLERVGSGANKRRRSSRLPDGTARNNPQDLWCFPGGLRPVVTVFAD